LLVPRLGLAELVEHLQDRGLPLRVVPSREDGWWGDNVYLTEDPQATWETFQLKNQTAQRIGQWRRSPLRRPPSADRFEAGGIVGEGLTRSVQVSK
jgi:hypothetical protein